MPRGAKSHAKEPVSQQVRVANGTSLLRQYQKHSLERIFGVVAIAQDLGANGENHGPVTRNQRGKRRFASGVSLRVEALEQLAVGHAGDRAAFIERADLPDD